ncbi:MAG: DUF433 domain-containing protein [Thermomicrobia bacterium]|nr:DUF433 domain-containing protein [Thermomicrobia bacterium]MCA1724318.1 DUF433 domain-containing protein [Thermomicrobia bacterium]
MATVRPDYADEKTVIRETSGVCGGYPCIGNTRIPVRAIIEAFHGYGSAEAVEDYFPQFRRVQVDAAHECYRHNPAHVDEDIASNNRAFAKLVYPMN